MRRRKHIHRATTVNRIATIRHTSHAGKNDPSTSKEGAREQLASTSEARISPYIIERLLLFVVTVGFMAPHRSKLPVPKARSSRLVRTCVRANTSVERACARVRWAAVTSRKLRTP